MKMGKDIDEIVDDILTSMKLIEIKVAEEEARIKNNIPALYQAVIALTIVSVLFLHYGGII